MEIGLRDARVQDFEYCKRLYFTGMEKIIQELNLDRAAQEVSFSQQWMLQQVRIITLEGSDVGWIQTRVTEDGLFVAQLFVDGPFQRRGIGTAVMNRLIAGASRARRAVCLDVVKINPALRFYERLGFRITGEEERKFNMKRDVDIEGSRAG